VIAIVKYANNPVDGEYYNKRLGYECRSLELFQSNNIGYYPKFIKSLDRFSDDIKIGPCGHVYVRHRMRWKFAKVTKTRIYLTEIKLFGRKSCKDCALRVDQ